MADAASEIDMIKEKQLLIKMKLVDAVHVTSTGDARIIRTDPKTGFVYTKLKGGKLVKAKDLERMYLKLYDFYYGSGDIYTVEKVFNLALEEKKATDNPKPGTVIKYGVDYRRFIDEYLAQSDIKTINEIDIKTYTNSLVNNNTIKKKAYLSYKGLLNLIFGYAMAHKIIDTNPVLSIHNSVYLKSCDCQRPKEEEKIFTPEEIQMLLDEVDRRTHHEGSRWGSYYIYGYAIKFAVQTGARIGELCAVRWDDIDFDRGLIHIHAQQLSKVVNHETVYYYVAYTKDERGISNDGRYFPLTDYLRELLSDLYQKQKERDIKSQYVFCYEDGNWMKTFRYQEFLYKLCKKFNLNVTNNHAFRMSLNSNVLIPNGISTTDRAKLLGHSVETNLKHYSFAQRDYVEKARDILNKPEHGKKVYLNA